MAAYEDLHDLGTDPDLLNKVEVAVFIAALDVFNDASPPSNQAARSTWARLVYEDPREMAKKFLPSVVAANKTATKVNIEGASDLTIQSNVDDIIDLFADNVI